MVCEPGVGGCDRAGGPRVRPEPDRGVAMATEEKVLSSTPGMLPLFARAGAAMIPGASKLPFVGGGGRADDVPELRLKLEAVRIDRERLAAYNRVCKFPLRDQLPPTYPHILAFPLHLALMTDRRVPLPAPAPGPPPQQIRPPPPPPVYPGAARHPH